MKIINKKQIIRWAQQALTAMAVLLALFCILAIIPADAATSRIKDIVKVEGVRENQLVGYGLVVGLNGSGDSINNSPFTEQSLIAMLERLGVNIRDQNFQTDNVAAVMVTANLPPFSNQGSTMDVTVSALGDANDLQGGTLLVTPLMGADGQVYAVAQGPIATGGFQAEGEAESVAKNVPTAGRISNGAIIEREIDFEFNKMESVRLALRNPDFTTAARIRDRINNYFGEDIATAIDPATVKITPTANYSGTMTSLVTDIEQLTVQPDQIAQVVVDESSGVIVMGADVRISEVAIAQGNLTIRITETPQVSQPNPFAEQGQTVVVDRTNIQIDEETDKKLAVLPSGVTLQELVEGLNALGVGPRDLITILQSIKAAGALQADIKVI